MAKKRTLIDTDALTTQGKLDYLLAVDESSMQRTLRAAELHLPRHKAQSILENRLTDEQKPDLSGGKQGFAPLPYSAGRRGRRI